MIFPRSTGRYVLDRHGQLHPLRRRYHIDVVAIVHIQMKRRRERGTPPPPPPSAPKPKLEVDLTQVPSSMEATAATWKGNR